MKTQTAILAFIFFINHFLFAIQNEYDNLNRLTRIDYGNGNVIDYSYDAIGNRTSQLIEGSGIAVVLQAVTIDIGKVNILSLNVVPEDISVSYLFAGEITLAVDDNGNFYYPSFGVDQLTAFDVTEGYQVLLSGEEPEIIEITGVPVYSGTPLLLKANKQNIIAYLPQVELAISEVFDASILLVKNDEGQYYLPGENIGDIITMYPGEGYYVFVQGDSDIEFSYPPDGASRMEFSNILEAEREARIPVHYKITGTGISHPIIITEISGYVEVGDELAAYANDELVGAVRIINLEKPIPLTAFGSYQNFGFNLSGYKRGDEIELRLWSNKRNSELEVVTQLDQSQYGMSPLSRGSAEVQSLIPDEYSLSQVYPNPFNPTTTINFALPEDVKLSIMVYDLQGREVLTLVSGNMEAGYHFIAWNAYSHSSGMYFVQMRAGAFLKTQKIMLVK